MNGHELGEKTLRGGRSVVAVSGGVALIAAGVDSIADGG